jgi:hypothetical protein
MPEITFHTNAEEEMRTAAAYYEAREQGFGDQFLDEVEEGLQRIQQFPRLWPIYEGDYRILLSILERGRCCGRRSFKKDSSRIVNFTCSILKPQCTKVTVMNECSWSTGKEI